MHWRAYARPFAKRRRLAAHRAAVLREIAAVYLESRDALQARRRLDQAERVDEAGSEITALWRDFISHMRAGGE